MNYYKRHIGDYLKDTAHLSLLEHGVYTRLLDVYYTREAGIAEDQAARLVGARSKEECVALQIVLEEFFELIEGVWIQDRCEREIELSHVQAEANRNNGKKGGRPKANHNPQHNPDETDEKPNGFSLGSVSETEKNLSHKPLAISHKNNTRAARFDPLFRLESWEVESSVARDWLAVRKAKRLPATETALNGVKAEADKAGVSMDEALRTCCMRGWGGFKADWLTNQSNGRMNGHSDNPFA